MESKHGLRYWTWIALVTIYGELFFHADGARLRKPTPSSTSWQRQACEAKEDGKEGSNYTCTPDGQLQCFEGWTGDLCNVPICKKGCDPLNGYCKLPGECRCRIGFSGELCRDCALLPGCVHGTCNKSFECLCKPGWTGLFCSQAICKEKCHKSRGFCEQPNECRCRLGWTGEFCEECQVVPGCRNGFCKKPLDCICKPGWTGLLCQIPVCKKGCSVEHGYCEEPDKCRCRVGWWGSNCDVCHPYPGCHHGYCHKPWECRCRSPEWTGFLCDQKIVSCAENSCFNGGTCLEPAEPNKTSGNITCICPAGYTGERCVVELTRTQDDTQLGQSSVYPTLLNTTKGGHFNKTLEEMTERNSNVSTIFQDAANCCNVNGTIISDEKHSSRIN